MVTKLDIQFDEYSRIAKKVREDLAGLLGENFRNRTEFVLLRSLKTGSTIVDANLALPDNFDLNSILEKVKQSISSMNTLGGVSIISVNKVAIYDPNEK